MRNDKLASLYVFMLSYLLNSPLGRKTYYIRNRLGFRRTLGGDRQQGLLLTAKMAEEFKEEEGIDPDKMASAAKVKAQKEVAKNKAADAAEAKRAAVLAVKQEREILMAKKTAAEEAFRAAIVENKKAPATSGVRQADGYADQILAQFDEKLATVRVYMLR
jgi:hypothetical protein